MYILYCSQTTTCKRKTNSVGQTAPVRNTDWHHYVQRYREEPFSTNNEYNDNSLDKKGLGLKQKMDKALADFSCDKLTEAQANALVKEFRTKGAEKKRKTNAASVASPIPTYPRSPLALPCADYGEASPPRALRCMYVYIYVCMFIHLYSYMHVHLYVFASLFGVLQTDACTKVLSFV